ncbi:MAG: MFS transporter [Chloroflexota bacterium]
METRSRVVGRVARLRRLPLIQPLAGRDFRLAWAGEIASLLVDRERLAAGNALMRGTVQFSGLVGPALGGVLVAAVGSGVSFAVGAIGFTLAAVALALMGRRPQGTQGYVGVGAEGEEGMEVGHLVSGGLLSSIWAGLRYAWADPVIRAILLAVAAVDFAFVGPVTVGLAPLSYAVAGALVDLNATLLFAAAGSLVLLSAVLTVANPAVRSID